jgi:hypothetical protein
LSLAGRALRALGRRLNGGWMAEFLVPAAIEAAAKEPEATPGEGQKKPSSARIAISNSETHD